MTEYDITFKSCNGVHWPKHITAFVIEPARITGETGLLHVAHGWGGNRYNYRELMTEYAERYNLVCVSTEFRQSGYDFDAVGGRGAFLPYDAGHYQVVDCLNAMRTVLGLRPGLCRRRLLAFGGSQGGHISLLMAVFAPATFALVIAACGISYLEEKILPWAGRDFSPDELAIRDVRSMAHLIRCPVALMHGTADETVSDHHTRQMEQALRKAGKQVIARYYEGGGHSLEPVTTRQKAAMELADDLLRNARTTDPDDFAAESRVEIPAVTKTYVLDWSKPPDDPILISNKC